jgi:hypothetical protein
MDQNATQINVNELVDDIDGKIPQNLKDIYQKTVLSGMRIMFDRRSHQMLLEELEKPEPMPEKIANGIIGLIYMLWTQSNQTLAPQIIVPVTVVLTLRAYEFLLKSGDPEASRQVLGEAMALATTGIMAKFGVSEEQLQAQGATQAPAKPGLIDAQMGGQ